MPQDRAPLPQIPIICCPTDDDPSGGDGNRMIHVIPPTPMPPAMAEDGEDIAYLK